MLGRIHWYETEAETARIKLNEGVFFLFKRKAKDCCKCWENPTSHRKNQSEKKNTQAFATFWPRSKEIIKKIIVDNIKCEDWNFSTHLHNNDTKLDFEIWDLRWRWSWRRTQTLCLEKIIRRKKTKPGD